MHAQFAPLLDRRQRAWNRSMVSLATVLAIVIACWYYVGLFDAERLGEGLPSLASLVGEMFPPNFSQAGSWVKPLLDTLAMSVAGTAVAGWAPAATSRRNSMLSGPICDVSIGGKLDLIMVK